MAFIAFLNMAERSQYIVFSFTAKKKRADKAKTNAL
jgi:hypothetical protein